MSLQLGAALQAILDHPLFGFGITLGAYQLALALFERTRWVFLQPVLLSMTLVVGVLLLCGIDYAEYRASVSMLSVFLGPATWRIKGIVTSYFIWSTDAGLHFICSSPCTPSKLSTLGYVLFIPAGLYMP